MTGRSIVIFKVTPNCFVGRDSNGQALTYVYYESEPARLSAAKMLTKRGEKDCGQYRQAAGAGRIGGAAYDFRLIVHPTCVIKPAVDGCPLVAANSMEIEKVRSFLLQVREKDHAAPVGGIVSVILSPLIVFPKYGPSCLFPHHLRPLQNQHPKGTAKNQSTKQAAAMRVDFRPPRQTMTACLRCLIRSFGPSGTPPMAYRRKSAASILSASLLG
jgi:hypothetical protein